MKPLGKGAKRTALVDNIEELMAATDVFPGMYDPRSLIPTVAVLGGALEASVDQLTEGLIGAADTHARQRLRTEFWRLFNDNTWRLTRSLKASGLLKEIK